MRVTAKECGGMVRLENGDGQLIATCTPGDAGELINELVQAKLDAETVKHFTEDFMSRPLILAVGKGCKACPFRQKTSAICKADGAERRIRFGDVVPDWCPIDKAPVHVVRAK